MYARLLAAAAAQMGPVPAVWRLFLNGEAARPPWDALAQRFYEELACQAVIYSQGDWDFSTTTGGRWLRPAEAVFYTKRPDLCGPASPGLPCHGAPVQRRSAGCAVHTACCTTTRRCHVVCRHVCCPLGRITI